jgi:glycolate oxidase iron-sulfur subunit
MDSLALANPELIASGNPGCMMQLRRGVEERGMKTRVEHPIELIDAFYLSGGALSRGARSRGAGLERAGDRQPTGAIR